MNDPHPDAERVQIDLIRKMTVAQRAARTRALTRAAYGRVMRALQKPTKLTGNLQRLTHRLS